MSGLEDRNPVFDILKGIGLILVVFGHCDFEMINQVVFSFHMPLFFFIAGYFAKKRNIKTEAYIGFRRLIVPYLAGFGTLFVLSFAGDLMYETNLCEKAWVSFLLGAKSSVFKNYFNESAYAGPLCFFLALFEVRLLFQIFVRIKLKNWIIFLFLVMLAVVAQLLAEKYGQIPLFIYPSLGCLGFFFVGYYLRGKDWLSKGMPKKHLICLLICWFFCIFFSKMGLHDNIYQSFYFIDLLGALGAFLFTYFLVHKYYDENRLVWRMLKFVGMNSIFLFFVHAIDHCFFFRWNHIWQYFVGLFPFSGALLLPILRVMIMISIGGCLLKITRIRNIVFFQK